MLLRNKTKYLLFAGLPGILTTPVYSQIYMCKQCPENTYSNGKECVPCGYFQYSSAGASRCTDLQYTIEATIANLSGATQTTGTLFPGFYVVILGGGNGGSVSGSPGKREYTLSGTIHEGYGAQLQYVIKVDKITSFTLASGAHGTSCSGTCASGGGGGSWLNINGTYYIAGGGGGAVANIGSWDDGRSSEGGAGGGVGGGGGGGDNEEGSKGSNGGGSGNYSGGLFGGGGGTGRDEPGARGAGPQGGRGGHVDRTKSCHNENHTAGAGNSYGGLGGLFSFKHCDSLNNSGSARYISCSSTYDSNCRCHKESCSTKSTGVYYRNGQNGSTSHPSNTSKFSSHLCRSCAKIFKIK